MILTTGLAHRHQVADGNYNPTGIVTAWSARQFVSAIALFWSDATAGHATASSVNRSAAAFSAGLGGRHTGLCNLGREEERVQTNKAQADRKSEYQRQSKVMPNSPHVDIIRSPPE